MLLSSPLLTPTLIISVAASHPFSSLTGDRHCRSSHPRSRILVTAASRRRRPPSLVSTTIPPQHCLLCDSLGLRKQYENCVSCPRCGLSRWKLNKNKVEKKDVPAKVIWYFPPIPRFKRMFKSLETSRNLTWHADSTRVVGQLRHLVDSPSWKLVDHMWPDFESEPRNLRLALAADGINPHSNLSSRYSCWPIMLVNYNLPPNMCMKRKYIMLTMLISGPKQPGNDIDVYLEVLVEDLQRLWEGVDGVYDAYRRQFFTLKAVLLWTINDFPAYGNLSGCTTHGYYACPVCGEDTYARHLENGKKMSFAGHRRFLSRFHPYRRQMKEFNGMEELGEAARPLSGIKLFDKLSDIRHCLDVMHIEKNVFESLINTLMNVKGKTKDNVAARLDMVEMGIRPELTPIVGEKRTYLPLAACSFTKKEKLQVCKSLKDIKVPEGFSSNMNNIVCMDQLKLTCLKSHDCHVLMQHFLPIVIRDVLPKHVRYAIIRLCFFFKDICCKVIDVAKLDKLQSDLVVTLCLLEQYFPPSFFDIMLHLTVHLVREVRLCGPVYFRWMYPFERCMKVLKSYVGSRKHPEGCIVQRYLAEEAIEFCSEYLNGVDPIGVPQSIRDSKANISGLQACNTPIVVPQVDLQQAHLTVLENMEEVSPYIIEHKTFLKSMFRKKEKDERWIQDAHNKRFIDWFRAKVAAEIDSCNGGTTSTLTWLAHGPRVQILKYNSYVINGNLYQTKARDDDRVCQNSGVSLVAITMLVCSAKDKNPLLADVSFYGVIEEIWELDYHQFHVPLFKCAWVANDKGIINNDECGFTLVNLNKRGHKNDEFVLVSQVNQVFYIDDPLKKGWSIVLPVSNRCYEGDDDDWSSIPDSRPIDDVDTHCIPAHERYFRSEIEGVWVTKKKK
ncbi:uncharacterized protein LOC121999300 [Zingiber officinale]|uniref:uncharacterized protein LOC121999300 n=1 Tax=Zingiber officinale TaxID=94328 RepID=UPI001C4C4551|nr:uncharacterized protein LOC121999300 [Zingiber officinale]